MIYSHPIKNLSKTLSLLTNTQKYKISTSNQLTIQQIRNQNLKFDTDNWVIHLYPFYPQIYKKKQKNIYEISNNNSVLSLVFVNKNTEDNIAWENRKSINMKFKDIGLILSAQMNTGKQIIIQTPINSKTSTIDRLRILTLKDHPKQSKISFHLRSIVDQVRTSSLSKLHNQQKDKDWAIEALMPYTEYKVFYKIIENSLLDLSGWRLTMQVQKRIQMNKMENRIIDEKETAELLKNNN